MIKINSFVCVYLQNPREKFWGRLYEFDAKGIQIVGIDFKSFNDWCIELDSDDETTICPSTIYIPAWRIEKIVLDETQGVYLSFLENFRQKTEREIDPYFPARNES